MRSSLSRAVLFCSVAWLGMVGVAEAFPSWGADCISCHSTPGGALTIVPDPILIKVGDSGEVKFDEVY